jgi:hypothetical protein
MFGRHTQSFMQRTWAQSRPLNRFVPLMATPMRFFDLHEYHSKKLMG